MKLSLLHKGILLVTIPLVVELVLLFFLGLLLAHTDNAAKRVDYYRRMIASTNSLEKRFLDASSLLTFYSFTHKEPLLDRYNAIYGEMVSTLSDLTDAAQKEKKHKTTLMKVCAIGNEAVELLEQSRESSNDSSWFSKLSASRLPEQLFQITNDYLEATGDLSKELEKTEQISPKDSARSMAMEFLCLGAGGVICITFIVLTVLFYRQLISKLVVLMDNTRRFANGQELHPVLKGEDEIVKLDQVFHSMSESIKESNEFRSQIVATVSHEIKTPLTSLKMFLTLLTNGKYGELSKDAELRSQLAGEQINRLIRLLNDLLAAETLRAKGFSIQLSRVDIATISRTAISSVAHLAEKQNIKVVNNVQSIELEADGDRILQVVVNLLSNAIKFSPRDAEIKLNSQSVNGELTFEVIDHGRGVPEELQEEIFNRLVQVEDADRSEKGGSGLGLAICKAIIVQHGGQIGCKNNAGQGSIFWFTLPLPQATGSRQQPTG